VKHPFPPEILTQHVAVLGKTGSGKTSTAKVLIEQAVAEGARVCILDPIKSDWWGLISSADGKRAGLPFHILGGPRGHVPLHAGAGKAIAEIVANGALPLSIIDMAEFEPGGQARFFVDFAPMLLRKMRGVVYLVIEEAHLFAPKERSGIGAENLSIHWAKTLATAGRSKGIRLVLVTQRTQALHNALLGSCDTMIAHRLTAPADQEPVVKWLKANTSKDVLEQVTNSLASLKTGDAWLCSGEARRFETMHFPRIATYDNTATPTGEGDTREVKTAAVDRDKLAAIIGEAVEQAKADDPRELRRQIADLRKQVAEHERSGIPNTAVPVKTIDRFVLKDGKLARAEKVIARAEGLREIFQQVMDRAAKEVEPLEDALREIAAAIRATVTPPTAQTPPPTRQATAQRSSLSARGETPAGTQHTAPRTSRPSPLGSGPVSSNGGPELKGGASRMLVALAQYAEGLSDSKLAILSGITKRGGSFRTYLSKLRMAGYVSGGRDRLVITTAGVQAAGDFDPLPTGPELIAYWQRDLGDSGARKLFDALVAAYPRGLSRQDAADAAGMTLGGGSFRTYLSKLKVKGLIAGSGGEFTASSDLFK
jgi:hypothetical protein